MLTAQHVRFWGQSGQADEYRLKRGMNRSRRLGGVGSSLQNLNRTGAMRVQYLPNKVSLKYKWGDEWIIRIAKSL